MRSSPPNRTSPDRRATARSPSGSAIAGVSTASNRSRSPSTTCCSPTPPTRSPGVTSAFRITPTPRRARSPRRWSTQAAGIRPTTTGSPSTASTSAARSSSCDIRCRTAIAASRRSRPSAAASLVCSSTRIPPTMGSRRGRRIRMGPGDRTVTFSAAASCTTSSCRAIR